MKGEHTIIKGGLLIGALFWLLFPASSFAANFELLSSATSQTTTAGTSHVINLPYGVAANDLILIIGSITGNNTYTAPAGFTSAGTAYVSNPNVTYQVWYKYATGSEGASVTATTAFSFRSTNVAMRIRNATTSVPVVVGSKSDACGLSNPNPPALSVSSATSTLPLAFVLTDSTTATVSSYPTSFSMVGGASGYNPNLWVSASAIATTTSVDPSAFSMSASNCYGSVTVAVYGANDATTDSGGSGESATSTVSGIATSTLYYEISTVFFHSFLVFFLSAFGIIALVRYVI